MKRKIVFCLLFVLLFGPTVTAYGTNISINGVLVPFTPASGSPFVDSANRTQVPLRAAMETYGCNVAWDKDTQTATISKEGTAVEVQIGAAYILRNGEKIAIDSPALIKDSRTYLPIRAVLESFGASIGWDANTQTVRVKNGDPANTMTIHFIDVGQGDSTFVDYGETELLVDAGNNSYGAAVVSYIEPYVDGNLDYIIATHTDADHIGGMDDVLRAFSVGTIYDSGDTADSITWSEYYVAAQAEPNCTIIPDADLSVPLGKDAVLKIIETVDGNGYSNYNSVISMIDYNNVEVFLAADMEGFIEKEFQDKWPDIDVLKAGHHGSYTASLLFLLEPTSPEYVIISAGLDNSYGHPHSVAMERFAGVGATVYGTFESGTIVMTTNGINYSFNDPTPNDPTPITVANAGDNSLQSNIQQNTTTTNQADIVFVGNSNTKKFHEADCPSVDQMADYHIVYFRTRAEAISAGYIPCKNCNP